MGLAQDASLNDVGNALDDTYEFRNDVEKLGRVMASAIIACPVDTGSGRSLHTDTKTPDGTCRLAFLFCGSTQLDERTAKKTGLEFIANSRLQRIDV